MRVRNLGNQQRRSAKHDGVAETKTHACGDEHAEVLGAGLQADGEQHNQTAYEDANLSSCPVNEIRYWEKADQ